MDPTPDEYAKGINACIGVEVKKRREALGLTAYALGREAGNVSDQTIVNIEKGRCPNGCMTGSLARICHRLGTTMAELMGAAERRWERFLKRWGS